MGVFCNNTYDIMIKQPHLERLKTTLVNLELLQQMGELIPEQKYEIEDNEGNIMVYQALTVDTFYGGDNPFNIVDLSAEKKFTLNGFIDSKGEFISDVNYRATSYLAITSGMIVKTSRRTNVEGLYFYNEYYSPIGAYTGIPENETVELKLDEIPIPSNAVYIRCSAPKNISDNLYYTGDDIGEQVSKSAITAQLLDIPIKGEFVNSEGLFFADENYDRTPYIPIGEYSIYGRQTTTTNLIYFYDEYYNPISGAKSQLQDVWQYVNLLDLEIPDNAIYFVMCTYNVGKPYIAKLNPQQIYSEIQYREKQLKKSLDNAFVRASTLVDYTGDSSIQDGYLTSSGGIILTSGWIHLPKKLAPKGRFIYHGLLTGGACILFYDINESLIGYFPAISGVSTDFEVQVPEETMYISFSSRTSYPIKYTVLEDYVNVFSREETLDLIKEDTVVNIYSVKNNMQTEESFLKHMSIFKYGESGVNGIIDNVVKSTDDFRMAFRFKIDENPNVENFKKELIKFEGVSNEDYLKILLKGGATTQLSGNDITEGRSPTTVVTNPPMCRYHSQFGLESSVTERSTAYLLNANMFPRTFVMPGEANDYEQCYKPLTGVDLFSIKFSVIIDGVRRRDTRAGEVQSLFSDYLSLVVSCKNGRFSITDTSVELYAIDAANYENYIDFINAIQNLNGSLIGDDLIIEINILDYYISRDATKIQDFDLHVISEYPDTDRSEVAFFYDSFPIYVTYGEDESWHTFEYIQSEGWGRMAIDGQYINPLRNVNSKLPMGQSFVDYKITFGHDLQMTIKDLTLECGGITDADFRLDNHFIISDYHPYMIHSYYHELINADIQPNNFIRNWVSEGGSVPDENKGPEGYGGDGNVNLDRVQLSNPTYVFKQALNKLVENGFVCPTKEEARRWATQGIAANKRMIVIDSDDHNAELIFNNHITRGLFAKYNIKITNAIELGYYIDTNAPTTTYDASEFILTYCNDTNEHRLKLQKMLQAMSNQDWNFDIHGNSNGFDFQTKTYFEIEDAIKESLDLCAYLGIDGSSWCFAGNRYTVNGIKMLEYNGLSYATSTIQEIPGICHHPCYRPRYVLFGTDIESWLFKIERLIF